MEFAVIFLLVIVLLAVQRLFGRRGPQMTPYAAAKARVCEGQTIRAEQIISGAARDIEAKHGPRSPETAQAQHELADIMLRGDNSSVAREAVARAVDILMAQPGSAPARSLALQGVVIAAGGTANDDPYPQWDALDAAQARAVADATIELSEQHAPWVVEPAVGALIMRFESRPDDTVVASLQTRRDTLRAAILAEAERRRNAPAKPAGGCGGRCAH